ncbi:uncharacterized protein LOC131695437 isoform X2 [Topomyia yanbarensis]|uniref:uncharacterized protein LOC131695437 isoform X2 n=1 Tax=Topomyia yanbarensis TaxID=2498891 RepID=UPI00273B4471|nr:uncharacterized protein LOC131695437 isoform X2 [Topomyia yanbarensis]
MIKVIRYKSNNDDAIRALSLGMSTPYEKQPIQRKLKQSIFRVSCESYFGHTTCHSDRPKMRCLVRIIYLLLLLQFAQSIDKKFVTCDFDLGVEVLPYLPEECHNLDEITKTLLTREAESFKQFHDRLTDHESRAGLDTEDNIHKDWAFREKLYGKAEPYLCRNDTETLQDYAACMIDKRADMVTMILESVQAP